MIMKFTFLQDNPDINSTFIRDNKERLSALSEQLDQVKDTQTPDIWYMRDNYTFRKLDIGDLSYSLAAIEDEFRNGWQYGAIFSKHECAPNMAHSNGILIEFLETVRAWIDLFYINLYAIDIVNSGEITR